MRAAVRGSRLADVVRERTAVDVFQRDERRIRGAQSPPSVEPTRKSARCSDVGVVRSTLPRCGTPSISASAKTPPATTLIATSRLSETSRARSNDSHPAMTELPNDFVAGNDRQAALGQARPRDDVFIRIVIAQRGFESRRRGHAAANIDSSGFCVFGRFAAKCTRVTQVGYPAVDAIATENMRYFLSRRKTGRGVGGFAA